MGSLKNPSGQVSKHLLDKKYLPAIQVKHNPAETHYLQGA